MRPPFTLHRRLGLTPDSWTASLSDAVHNLFILNLVLQLWDGIATYHGVNLGVEEGNPLVRTSMLFWGVGEALFLWKSLACGLLWLVRRVGENLLTLFTFALTAMCYVIFSTLPWLLLLILHAGG
jgi:hypothetical protein